MKSKKKYPCVICGKKYHTFYGPKLDHCHKCKYKLKSYNKIPAGPLVFQEPLSENIIFHTSLTATQKKLLIKRLKFIFPLKNHDKEMRGLSDYLRKLILEDLKKFEEEDVDGE